MCDGQYHELEQDNAFPETHSPHQKHCKSVIWQVQHFIIHIDSAATSILTLIDAVVKYFFPDQHWC
jgi:hypothetical protein